MISLTRPATREKAVAIEKNAVERPSLPAFSSNSGGMNGVVGVGAGIAMNVEVSIDTASWRRSIRSASPWRTGANSSVDGSNGSGGVVGPSPNGSRSPSRSPPPCSLIALFSFAARAAGLFHGQYPVTEEANCALGTRAPREPALQEHRQDAFQAA